MMANPIFTLPKKTHNGFLVLPIRIPSQPSLTPPCDVHHYVYIRRQKSKIPDPERDPRTLFVANIPVDTTTTHLRALFKSIGGGLVESVNIDKFNHCSSTATITEAVKKRKTQHMTDSGNLDYYNGFSSRPLYKPGTNAVVVFVDSKSCEASLTAVKKSSKGGSVVWGQDVCGVPPLGAERYIANERASHPDLEVLKASVDEFIIEFNKREHEETHFLLRRRQEPDEDGFITVTRRGSKIIPASHGKKCITDLGKNQKPELKGFYRFQVRDERKAKQQQLQAEFEKDKKLVEEGKIQRKY